jgi:hypothetical protein
VQAPRISRRRPNKSTKVCPLRRTEQSLPKRRARQYEAAHVDPAAP